MSFLDRNGKPANVDFEKDEQSLVRQYVPKNSTVLELGARYGTVSCVISETLEDPTRHVAVEPDETVLQALEQNKKRNGGKFHIFSGVISNKKYKVVESVIDMDDEYREYGTYTKEISQDEEGGVKSMSLEELQKLYGLQFDCIVADCEGFFCDFIDENPWILDQIHTLVLEKDGSPWSVMCLKYEILEKILVEKHFSRVISIPHPLHANNPHLHSVWKRTSI